MKCIVGDDTGLLKVVTLRTAGVARFGAQLTSRNVEVMSWAGIGDHLESEVAIGLRSGVVEVWDIERGTHLALPPIVSTTLPSAPSTAITPKGAPMSVYNQWRADHTAKGGAGVHGPLRAVGVIGGLDARRVVTATDAGIIQIRPLVKAEEVNDDDEEDSAAAAAGVRTWAAGANLCTMRINRTQNQCATGGREHLLKLWDLETGTHIFKEKNVPHDFLDMRVPVWISDIQYSPQDPHIVYTSTSHGQLRVYDTRAGLAPVGSMTVQTKVEPSDDGSKGDVDEKAEARKRKADKKKRLKAKKREASGVAASVPILESNSEDSKLITRRPHLDLKVTDISILSIAASPDGNWLAYGDGAGRLAQVDMRAGLLERNRTLGGMRGIGGAIRAVSYHPSPSAILPLHLASVGLDRYLRVYDATTRKLAHKIYLKQKLNCVLFSSSIPDPREAIGAAIKPEEEVEAEEVWRELEQRTVDEKDNDDNDDELSAILRKSRGDDNGSDDNSSDDDNEGDDNNDNDDDNDNDNDDDNGSDDDVVERKKPSSSSSSAATSEAQSKAIAIARMRADRAARNAEKAAAAAAAESRKRKSDPNSKTSKKRAKGASKRAKQ